MYSIIKELKETTEQNNDLFIIADINEITFWIVSRYKKYVFYKSFSINFYWI